MESISIGIASGAYLLSLAALIVSIFAMIRSRRPVINKIQYDPKEVEEGSLNPLDKLHQDAMNPDFRYRNPFGNKESQ